MNGEETRAVDSTSHHVASRHVRTSPSLNSGHRGSRPGPSRSLPSRRRSAVCELFVPALDQGEALGSVYVWIARLRRWIGRGRVHARALRRGAPTRSCGSTQVHQQDPTLSFNDLQHFVELRCTTLSCATSSAASGFSVLTTLSLLGGVNI